jgi:O-methyltransferase involved in polyketide biosynthesis
MTSAKKEWTRSDGDQWDIVTSVGYTALAVAALRAVANARSQPLARDDYAQSGETVFDGTASGLCRRTERVDRG